MNNFGKGPGGDLIDMGFRGGSAAFGGAVVENGYSRWGENIEMERVDGGMSLGPGHYSEYRGGLYDGMALSSEFLGEYYSNVSTRNGRESIEWDQEFGL